MTIGQMIVYAIVSLLFVAVAMLLIDKYVTVPVAHQIAKAIADMFTGATSKAAA
jgi:hypothetical protein